MGKSFGEAASKEAVSNLLKDDHVQLAYSPAVAIQAYTPGTSVGTRKGVLKFEPLNYVSRVVTTRYKTWDEIWAEIGGTWATAVLLVSAFFAAKTVEDPKKKGQDGAPMEEVQVFRLRGQTSKKGALKAMYGIATDAYGAA